MALGGGTFTTQNKVLPGAYINFVSVARATATLSDRGYVAMPLELDWGISNEIMEVTKEDFIKNTTKIFGYDYTHEKMKGLRDLFMYTNVLYTYCLNDGGAKAENEFGKAKRYGVRGNDLKVVIQANVDHNEKFDVTLYLGNVKVDFQTVAGINELIDNDFVEWNKDATLDVTSGTPFVGGSNGSVTGETHQTFLNLIESYSFNTMGVVTTEETIKRLYVAFAKRMREEIGSKFQLVIHNFAGDYEGVVNVKNIVEDPTYSIASLVYWVTGVLAGCEVNKSCLNRKYNGEFVVNTNHTQTQLKTAIANGEFTLHKVGSDIRVLADINSLVTVTDEKGDVFKENQTIRVIDQIAVDIANIFNTKYLGVVPNNQSGRIGLWSDIVKHHEQLQELGAIENFKDADVVVEQGDTKKSVVVSDYITVVNAMAQLYMTVKVA